MPTGLLALRKTELSQLSKHIATLKPPTTGSKNQKRELAQKVSTGIRNTKPERFAKTLVPPSFSLTSVDQSCQSKSMSFPVVGQLWSESGPQMTPEALPRGGQDGAEEPRIDQKSAARRSDSRGHNRGPFAETQQAFGAVMIICVLPAPRLHGQTAAPH